MGGGLAYIPRFLVYPISVISGTGPLWFIQMLFLFSCILVLLKKADKTDAVWKLCQKANSAVLIFLFVLIYGAAQILNTPVLTMYRFGIYLVSFLIGYYVFSHNTVQTNIEKLRIPMLCAAIAGAAVYAFRYGTGDYTSPSCLQNIVTNLYLWLAVLAIIGCGKHYWNRETAFTRYMAKSSFGLYILHYPILIVTCYLLYFHFDLPVICNYMIALAAELILTPALYEAIKRIPIIRYLVLGIKQKK